MLKPPLRHALLLLALLGAGAGAPAARARAAGEAPVARFQPNPKTPGAVAAGSVTPAEKNPRPTGLVDLSLSSGAACEPLAARISIRDPWGKIVGALPGLTWAWVDGAHQVRIPAGAVNVQISAGPRRGEWRGTFTAVAGQTRRHHFMVPEYVPVAAAGWRLVDPFVQASSATADSTTYAFSTLAEVSLAARGEGVEIAGLGGTWNLLGATGVAYAESGPGGRQRLAQSFSAAERERFLPFFAWSAGRAGSGYFYALEPEPVTPGEQVLGPGSLFEIFPAIQDRGGIVVMSHPAGELLNTRTGASSHLAGELVLAVLAGPLFDALDISRGGADLELWQLLLNHGYRIPALGGGPEPDPPDELDLPALGAYLHLPPGRIQRREVIAAIRTGRTIVSNGPFVRLLVNGRGEGQILAPSRKTRLVLIEALACSDPADSIRRVELIYNGRCVKSWRGRNRQKSMRIRLSWTFPDAGWIAVRYRSTEESRWAISNPVYVSAEGRERPRPTSARVTLTLADARTGEPLAGSIAVWNRGVCIQEMQVGPEPVTLLLPPTAEVRAAAPGYAPGGEGGNVYRDGGPARMIADLARENRLRPALLTWDTYERMKKALADVRLKVSLRPLASPGGKANTTTPDFTAEIAENAEKFKQH